MLIFDLEFKRKAFGHESPLWWFYDDSGRKWEINRKGVLFLSLFFITFCAFVFLTIMICDCMPIPIVDVTVSSHILAFNTGNEFNAFACIISFDPNHEISYYLQLIGGYDPANQFSALLGISLNYSNYIKSIPYKFA